MSPDGRLIADAIFSMPKPVLAGHLALLEEVNLLSLLTSKASGFIDKSQQDSIGLKVKARAVQLSGSTSDTDLALRLVAQLSQIVGASPHQYTSEREFDDAAADIIAGSVTSLRNAEGKFTGSSLQDMVQFTVESMFGEVGKRFDDLSSEKQADVLKAVRDFIAQLPHDQQMQVRAKLGLDDLSDEFLGKAVVSGTFASAFAGAVSIGGFGVYTGAVSLVSAMAGLVGLTLPFAFYTSLTSAIAVAANPLFVVPAVAGGGFLLYRNQNGALRKRLAINTVVQLALFGSSLTPGSTTDARMRAVAAWHSASEAIRTAEGMRASAQQGVTVAEHRLSTLRDSLRSAAQALGSAIADRSKLVSSIRTEVASRASDIAAGEWGKPARECGEALASAQKSQQTARRPVGKAAGAFMSPFLHVARAVQTVSAGMHVEKLVAVATETILDLYLQDALSTSTPVLSLLAEVKQANSEIHSHRAQVATNESAIEDQRRSLTSARKLLQDAICAIQKATNSYWGLTS
jgi:uncharacterized protein YlxW (UPF0749 family)